ncbi:iron donor protein CyaY [Gallaecimonas xiamenensis]|uniref:Iron-sulfur cluster assembly protein CyaY n=1 Tax=Gallaecimonas xiamenensis 3-C-1 TaxID=745411 RepID=K2IZD1_9GAMM|nr:iron donor protein CyaY [Gallaecimonas xiamenensis]EKE75886.1 iron scavenging protein [Gallaecimonas xiamenensis 3-C-1]
MNDSQYEDITDALLLAIEDAVESAAEQNGLDIEVESVGGKVDLIFPDRSKIILNKQPPLQQIWVATKFNGHHFGFQDGQWIDVRSGAELFAFLDEAVSRQAGSAITLGL